MHADRAHYKGPRLTGGKGGNTHGWQRHYASWRYIDGVVRAAAWYTITQLGLLLDLCAVHIVSALSGHVQNKCAEHAQAAATTHKGSIDISGMERGACHGRRGAKKCNRCVLQRVAMVGR